MSKLDYVPKNNTPRRISVDDLHKLVDSLSPEIKESDGDRTIILANTVLAHFLGRDWCEIHIRHDAPKSSYLRIDFSSDGRKKTTVFRVVELAENLFNLQNIEGFDACVAQMKGGAEKIESTCAELISVASYTSMTLNFALSYPYRRWARITISKSSTRAH
jgi:hypothetical protein